MKNISTTIKVLVMLTCMASLKLAAQGMSGAYTINQLQPASATNFISFNALATALTSSGVTGPVTVNVVANSGPYNEQVTFPQINGMNASNNVIINGNNNMITFNPFSSSSAWTILMNGVDYMTINNLIVQGQNQNWGYPVLLTGGANYNNFSACTFSLFPNGTSSQMCAFGLSSSNLGVNYTGTDAGNFNVANTCTMIGGYWGVAFYGLSSPPYQQGNKVLNCEVLDWYLYGVYLYYSRDNEFSNNNLERPTRTFYTTTYGGLFVYNQGLRLERNRLHNLYPANILQTGTMYGWFGYYNTAATGSNRNYVRNNMIYDIKSNTSIYGLYWYYGDAICENNTFNLDHTASGASGTTWAIYAYGNAQYPMDVNHNIINLNRGGFGSKTGFYCPIAGNITFNRNDMYVVGTNTNYAYYNTNHMNLASLQGTGMNLNGWEVDPIITVPQSTTAIGCMPTNTVINNQGLPNGLQFDNLGFIRNQTTPDIGALEFLTPLCTGTPSTSVSGPTFAVCPGEPFYLGLNNLNSSLGITYQWNQSSISQVGPWNALPNGASIGYAVPGTTANTWYQCVISCTAPGGSSVSSVAQVTVAGTTTNTVPYFEGFETVGVNGRLPNCSWLASSAKTYTSAQSGNRLPRTGSSFATYEAGATNTYYTNGIYLNAGVNYSASVWYQSDFTGATNWSDLSVMVGTAQTIASQSLIASTNGPAVSPIYKSLSGTFSVSTSGFYNVAVKAIGNSGAATYLSIDDLRIEIPCNDPVNAPALVVGAGASTNVCQGAQVNLVASGANTYSWNTGGTTAAIVVTPNIAGLINYNVIGTNTLSGCAQNVNITLNVKPAPIINAFCIPANVCPGKSANLQASGNGVAAYLWNTGASGAILAVTPSASAVYTVQGTSSNGCLGSQTVAVNVNPTPTITGSASRNQMCLNESVSLSATGGVSYIWSSNNSALVLQGSPANAVAAVTGPASYTVTGTDANGCTGTAIVNVNVEACTGIKAMELGQGLQVYPNPTSGVFALRSQAKVFTAELMDMTGRVIATTEAKDEAVQFNLGGFAAGVYFVKVSSAEGVNIVKVVKQ